MDERIGRAMKLITVMFMSDMCARDLKEKYPRLLYCNTSALFVQGIEKNLRSDCTDSWEATPSTPPGF